MKNKFPLLIISILILMGCASNEKEEAEPPEVQLYRMAQDRINAKNFLGAVDSLARIERFYPFGFEDYVVEGDEKLKKDIWQFTTINHLSWADIFVFLS